MLGIGSPSRRKQRKKCRVPYSSEVETSMEINILLPLPPPYMVTNDDHSSDNDSNDAVGFKTAPSG